MTCLLKKSDPASLYLFLNMCYFDCFYCKGRKTISRNHTISQWSGSTVARRRLCPMHLRHFKQYLLNWN